MANQIGRNDHNTLISSQPWELGDGFLLHNEKFWFLAKTVHLAQAVEKRDHKHLRRQERRKAAYFDQ